MRNICSVENCGEFAKARGFCNHHYCQWYYRSGGPQGNYIKNPRKTDDPVILKPFFDMRWKLSESGCWQWIGAVTKAKPGKEPYGRIVANGRPVKAHRLSWIIHRAPIASSQWVLHRCNNSLCVNPEHLYIGTHVENMRDMAASGRGYRRKLSKLSDDDVREIRKRTESIAATAQRYGVNKSTIKDIRAGRIRVHV
jgi:hypothetical protein